MNKLFGLFLLALACWAPDVAQAASRFLTCATTCTITAADTSIWGTSTGGTGASVPGASDDVILDAATCVGGTTCTATFGAAYNPTWLSLTMSACTASTAGCILDANPNTNTITLTAATGYVNTGAGTRTLSGGTWIVSNNASIWNCNATCTLTNSPSVSFTGTGGTTSRRFTNGAAKTYGTVSVTSGTAPLVFSNTGTSTIGTFTVFAGNRIIFSSGATLTVTTITNISGSSSASTLFVNDNPTNGVATVSSANNWTCDWCGISGMTFSGGGTFAATNSLSLVGNTGITITPPSGGGGGRIIGG